MPAADSIKFFFLDAQCSLKDRNKLRSALYKLFKKNGRRPQSLRYIFCSDEYLLRINQQFLKHDYYTDIITFDLTEPGAPLHGEIYISLDRVRDNAKTYQSPFYRELHRVIFHGALHLCGYRDKKPAEQRQMRQAEDNCLSNYFK